MSGRSTGLAVRNAGPPIALLRASIVCFSSDFLFPSLCREGNEGWVCIVIPAAEGFTCDEQAKYGLGRQE